MDKKCLTCECELKPSNRSGRCRACYVQRIVDSKKRPLTNCDACSAVLNRRVKLGLCRDCYAIAYRSRPETKARVRENSIAWRAKNPGRHSENSIRWQKNNPERTKEIRFKTRTGLQNRFTTEANRAGRRGLSWTLTREEFASLRAKTCFYCSSSLDVYGSGLDRIDNARGYDPDNVVPCCGKCNRVRGDDLTHEEMKVAMDAVVRLRQKQRLRLVLP